jgi:PAS domain-containing protein
MSNGVVSAVVVPLRSSQSDYGTLGIYHDFPRPFAKADVQFVESAGKMLTLAIERSCLEFNLRATTQLQTTLLQSPCLLYVLMRPDGTILNANRGLLDLLGRPADQVHGHSLGDWIEVSQEFVTLATIINQTRSGPVQIEATLRTQGDPRRVNWTFRKSEMPDGQWQCLVTGFDITAQNAAVERALSAERDLAHLREALIVIQRAADAGDLAEVSRTLRKMGLAACLETPPATPTSGSADTRAHERHSFHSAQQIAPIVDDATPSMEDFFTVTCLDLSVGGISFLLTAPPVTREYVVLLGTKPNYLHIRAEVRNCRPYQLGDQEYFRIGCRFTDRVRQLP